MRIPLKHATRYGVRLSTPIAVNQTLQHRIAEALDRNSQIIPVLELWRQQGNHVNPSHMRVIIKELRDSKHSHQALQVSEWMSKEKMSDLLPEDFSARLHLIENVLGLDEAGKFFQSIPKSAKDDSVYTTLLICYARSEKTLCKAEATFKKMRELGLLLRPSPYNAMMSLYIALKDRDKVEELFREMTDGVGVDSVTVNNVLKLYSALSDVAAIEKFRKEWDGIKLDWLTTLDMAKAYMRTGTREMAIAVLRLTEKSMDSKSSKKSAYEILMKLYGEAGMKDEVLRIWNLYKKKTEECDNEGYLFVIGSFLKLEDIDGAEEIYKEWECLPFDFDIRIPTMMASSYRDRGMIEKAEKLMINKTIKNRRMNKPVTPLLEQWENQMKPSYFKCLIKNLCDSNQLSKALQVSEWMVGKGVFSLHSEDYAARLHLIENFLGLEEAEKFFEDIPEKMKDYSVYATMLSSYAKSDKTFDKAKATFKKMRELGLLFKPSPFNSMLSFYSRSVRVEKILGEMEENNVEPDSLTVNKVLRVYAAESKVEAMETFMRIWSGEQGIKLERGMIVAIAKAYHVSGSIEKAIELYGDLAGSKGKVYYLWNEYKKAEKVEDDGYRSLISSLLKLDDVQGAEKIYGEWKPDGPKLDLSTPGLLISRFCAQGNELKFKELVKSITWKRNGMYFRMVKRFTLKIVKGVAIFLVFVVGVGICGFLKRPYLIFLFW